MIAAVCVVIALQMLELINLPIDRLDALLPTKRSERKGLVGAFVFGMLFGLVASPCSTPILAAIAAIAATTGSAAKGGVLLFVYGLGKGVPFMLLGLASGSSGLMRKISKLTPVLLAKPGSVYLPSDTTDIMILGGTGAVSSAVETYVEGKLGAEAVQRVGGANRYETAAMIAQEGVEAGLTWNGVGIASGESFPDALAGGSVAGLQRTVVLLTTPDALNAHAVPHSTRTRRRSRPRGSSVALAHSASLLRMR